MRGDGNRRRDAERNGGEHRRRDQRAVHERVERVADDDERRAELWTWQSSSSWQCRQMTAFSSRKKLRMPPSEREHRGARGELVSASGTSASSATPTSVPTA